MKTAIETHNLGVRIAGSVILSDVSISIPEGKVVGLLGPSGAGKTTLMRAIVGLQAPTSGNVAVYGLAAGSRALRSQIGYLTQAPSVYADLTVTENLGYFAAMVGAPKGQVGEVIMAVELKSVADHLVGSLSGGQRARASLAVAMLGKPRLLILDEPTVGLDPLLRNVLWVQFRELAASGVTILVSSHVMDEADRCDELLLLRDGRVLATGTPDSLRRETKAKDIEGAFIALVGGAA